MKTRIVSLLLIFIITQSMRSLRVVAFIDVLDYLGFDIIFIYL